MKRLIFVLLIVTTTLSLDYSQSQCNASFTSVPDTANPCRFFFTNTSTGGINPVYVWNFGAGSSATAHSPSHSYTTNGSCTVTLTMVDSFTGCFNSFTRTVSVIGCGQVSCTAAFSAFPDSLNSCTYNFLNNSTGPAPLSYRWFFGSGISSTQTNPSHTFTSNGTYNVTLIVSNASGCFDSTSQTVTITGCSMSSCSTVISAFPDSTNPCTYYFNSVTTGTAPFSYRWNFGHGSSSKQSSPAHTYASNGN